MSGTALVTRGLVNPTGATPGVWLASRGLVGTTDSGTAPTAGGVMLHHHYHVR